MSAIACFKLNEQDAVELMKLVDKVRDKAKHRDRFAHTFGALRGYPEAILIINRELKLFMRQRRRSPA